MDAASEVFSDPNLSAGRQLLLQSGFGQELGSLMLAVLRACELGERAQEAVILTMARSLRHEYAWQEHVPRALQAGVTREDIRAIGRDELDRLPGDLRSPCEYARCVLADVKLPDTWPENLGRQSPDPFAALVGTILVIFTIHRSADLQAQGSFVGWGLESSTD